MKSLVLCGIIVSTLTACTPFDYGTELTDIFKDGIKNMLVDTVKSELINGGYKDGSIDFNAKFDFTKLFTHIDQEEVNYVFKGTYLYNKQG